MKKDKILHLLAGAFITFISFFILVFITYDINHSILGGFLMSLVIGFGKEMIDVFTGGKFNFLDLLFTLIGGLIVTIALLIISL